MGLEENRLTMAARITAHALRATPDAYAAQSIAAFEETYRVLAELDTGDDDWTDETLDAAWDLVRAVYPKGGVIFHILTDLRDAHAAIIATADPPSPDSRRRPRRDA
jgi:hypothetical protein